LISIVIYMPLISETSSVDQGFPKIAILLVNVGAPDAPTIAAARRFLRQFLSDSRIVEGSLWRRWVARNVFTLFYRSIKLAKRYGSIWAKDGSPLLTHTEKQAKKMGRRLEMREHDVHVVYAMRYGNFPIKKALDRLKEEGYERILILPAYPQYCDATTGAAFDAVAAHFVGQQNMPELRFVRDFHDHEGYIGALVESVRTYWETHGRSDKLVISFRGIQKGLGKRAEDYMARCVRTAQLLAERLVLATGQYEVTFQSCFGPGEWVEPHIATTLEKLGKEGVRRVDVVSPGFVADCIETLEEIDIVNRQKFLSAGGKDFRVIPCLNESDQWLQAFAEIAEQHLLGWPTMQKNSEVGQPSSSRRPTWR
jgi:protoporphyrin/coproporphyrin ferrochelatase